MGKVDGCRGGGGGGGVKVFPDYPCPHRELINVYTYPQQGSHPLLLFKSTGYPSARIMEAIPPPKKLWIGILPLFKLSYDMSIRTCSYQSSNHIYFTRVYHREEKVCLHAVPYYTLLVPSVSFCSVLPPQAGQQNLSARSKKYVEVDGFVKKKKWPIVLYNSTDSLCWYILQPILS